MYIYIYMYIYLYMYIYVLGCHPQEALALAVHGTARVLLLLLQPLQEYD